ncbi:MAG TPA: hypothetical protein DCE80_18925, partial [Ignavibacteriales bacterium]|nr:hypothetical protein [Ignavibacteriales bacterium]
TYLLLNGSVEAGVNFSQSGLQGTFAGTFENIIPGANLVQIFVNDNNNNTQEFIYTFYMFNDGGVGEYTEDANTLGLWHMNENAGTIIGDSSGNGYDFDMSMFSWIWNLGVFQTSGVSVNNHTGLVNIPVIENLASFTIEGWFKATSDNTNASPMFSAYSGYSLLTRGGYGITPQTITLFRPTNYSGSGVFSKEILLTDGFHHIAIVADKDHPYKNYYFLVDGKVLYSGKLTLGELILNQDGTFRIGGNNDVDEIRFSDVSRYELKYKQ